MDVDYYITKYLDITKDQIYINLCLVNSSFFYYDDFLFILLNMNKDKYFFNHPMIIDLKLIKRTPKYFIRNKN